MRLVGGVVSRSIVGLIALVLVMLTLPAADGINNTIIGPSQVLGSDLRDAFAAGSGEPVSNYDGVNGIRSRRRARRYHNRIGP
jgi:hypothetical protein